MPESTGRPEPTASPQAASVADPGVDSSASTREVTGAGAERLADPPRGPDAEPAPTEADTASHDPQSPDEAHPSEAPDAAESAVGPAGTASLLRVLVATAARAVLMTIGAMLLWAGLPMLLGWHTTTVLTGSMEPRLLVGDLAVSRPVQPSGLRIGQTILFDDPDHHGRLRLHRLVAINDQGQLVTRGDANPQNDSSPVDPATVRGVATLRVPYIAMPRVWVAEGQWGYLGATAVGLVLLVLLSRIDRTAETAAEHRDDESDDESDTESDDRPDDSADDRPDDTTDDGPDDTGDDAGSTEVRPAEGSGTTPRRRRRRVLAAVAIPAATAVVASSAITQATSYSAFSDTVNNTGNSLSAAPFYKCANAITADGPRIWYRLDETGTTTVATDSSGQSRPGTYRGGGFTLGATRACASDTGTAVTFNGSSSFITSNTAFTAPNVMTIETWFKTTSTRGGLLAGWGDSQTAASTNADRQLYLTNSGQVSFSVLRTSTSKTTITSSATARDGAWHHAAATLSTDGMVLYLDGKQVASNTTTTSGASYTGYFHIGMDKLSTWTNAPTSTFLAATLDDVAVYNVALTAGDIADHYNAAD